MPSRLMHFQVVAAALAFAFALPGARTEGQATPRVMGVANATAESPSSRLEGSEALDAAVAAALMGATREQFDVPAVEIKLDSTTVEPVSPRDREVSGSGRLSLDAAHRDWLSFQYRVLYDTEAAVASAPRITLGSAGEAEPVARTSPLAKDLVTRARLAILREFAGQPVRLRLERVASADAGRYRHITANGLADFGPGGGALVEIDALYDPASSRWIRIRHEIGASAPNDDLRTSASLARTL